MPLTLPRTFAALLCAALLAVAGCGGDDEPQGAGGGSAATEQRDGGGADPGTAGGDEPEIPASVPDVFYGDAARTEERIKPAEHKAGSERAAMRQVVVDFYAAAAEGDAARACGLMTDEGRAALVESVQGAGGDAQDCEQAAAAIREQAGDVVVGPADPDMTGAPTGVVPAQVADYEPVYVEVVKTGDAWKVDVF